MYMSEFLDKVDKTLRYYRNKILLQLRLYHFQIRAVKLIKPVFVVGCSRAGTTLIYKTFSESQYLGSLQKETHDFWAALHPPKLRNWQSHEIPVQLAKQEDIRAVSRFFYTQTGKTRIVDKNNQNGLSIPYLFKLFPSAHFIYIKRNPGDNINSLIQGWNKASEFATWSTELPDPVRVEGGKNQRWCFFLAKGWRKYTHASIEEVCAFQYKAMNNAILDAKANIPEGQWHEINYEKLINEPVQEFEKLFNHCDIPFDQHLQQHCKDVLQKPYNTFSEIRINKWRDGANKTKIDRVLSELETVAKRMGY